MHDKSRYKCSFCGKSQNQVQRLIAGPESYICDGCIDLCCEIMAEEQSEQCEDAYPDSIEGALRILKAHSSFPSLLRTLLGWIRSRCPDPSSLTDAQLATVTRAILHHVTRRQNEAADDDLTIRGYRDELANNPTDVATRRDLALSMYRKQLLSAAVPDLERLADVEPGNPEYHYYLAHCYTKLGRTDEARARWQLVVSTDQSGSYTRRATRLLELLRAGTKLSEP